MAFKNLEERFNAKVNDLYDGAKLKFDGGRASTGINDNPLMVRRPGENRFGLKYEGRSIPFNSAPRDVVRLSLFSVSTRGLAFYVKQQLLQTGNTFEAKRLINPLFVIANGIPFLHVRRHLDPPFNSLRNFISAAFKINPSPTDTNYNNVKKLGQLQVGTYNKWKNERLISPITNLVSAFTAKNNIGEVKPWSLSRPELGADGYVVKKWLDSAKPIDFDLGLNGPLGSVISSVQGFGLRAFSGVIRNAINDFRNAEKNSSFLHGGKIKPDGVGATLFIGSRYGVTLTRYSSGVFRGHYSSDYKNLSLSDLNSTIPENNRTRLLSEEPARVGLDTRYKSSEAEAEKIIDASIENFQEDTSNFFKEFDEGGVVERRGPPSELVPRGLILLTPNSEPRTRPFLKYFNPTGTRNAENPEQSISSSAQGNLNARDLALDADGSRKKISYVRDPLNDPPSDPSDNLQSFYRRSLPTIEKNGKKDDPVTVSFAMGNNDHVQFRAFITNLTHSANPDYKPYQYIGRIEKFIMYNSVQREVGFNLGVVAFSKHELDVVWSRINYLTSFVFPYDFNRGILQPNIIRFTIGDVFKNQPGYVTSFSTNFNQLTDSWDIDKEVPIAASVAMRFAIIEKNTKWSNRSFYGIFDNQDVATNPANRPRGRIGVGIVGEVSPLPRIITDEDIQRVGTI
jgi:hypothetical protein